MSLKQRYQRQKLQGFSASPPREMPPGVADPKYRFNHIFKQRNFCLWEEQDSEDYAALVNRSGVGEVEILRRDIHFIESKFSTHVFCEWFELEKILAND